MLRASRKHAYSNILKISPPKTENFLIKNSDIFSDFCSKLDCGYMLEPPHRDGSIEYPQSMFLSRNKKNNVYLCKPQFNYIKVGFKGSKLNRYVFVTDCGIPGYLHLYFPVCFSAHPHKMGSTVKEEHFVPKISKFFCFRVHSSFRRKSKQY